MYVNAIPEQDRVHSINIGIDNWWLLSFLVFWCSLSFNRYVFLIEFALPIVVIVLTHELLFHASFRMHRMEQLDPSDFPSVLDLIREITKEMEGVSINRILYGPTDYQLSARVFHTLGRSRLYLSAAACVAGEKNPAPIKAIIAHELARVANKDYLAKVLAAGIIVNMIGFIMFFVAYQLQSLELPVIFYIEREIHRVPLKDPSVALFGIFIAINLLRRREYMADAAFGSTYVDGNNQLRKMLLSIRRPHLSLSRPSPDRRAKALMTANPVLRPNRLLLILLVPVFIFFIGELAGLLYLPLLGGLGIDIIAEMHFEVLLGVAGRFLIVITAFREIRKDGTNKIPYCSTGYNIDEKLDIPAP